MLTVLLTTAFTVNAQNRPDIGTIISGLSQKAIGALKQVAIPVLNRQVNLVKAHIDGILAFFQSKEGDVSISFFHQVPF